MKILYYDCFAGVSGDMNLAAMLDLGVDPDHLRSELSKLGLDHEFELKVSTDSRKGIHGTRVDVILKDQDHHHSHHESAPDHNHAHTHDHGPAEHHGEESSPLHHGEHRNLRDIKTIINASSLSDEVKSTSLAIFRHVAQAEAKVHGKGIYEVHFHEVGATDSIVDIVGAAICIHSLGVDAVWSSPVELGGGFVRCAHGVMPVPAPATVEILTGIPTTRGAVKSETTTPTGAAILAALADEFTATPQLVTKRTGYGIGHRDPEEIPNVLRVHIATPLTDAAADGVKQARLLHCNIDDMTPEMLAAAMELLMENGAMDVHLTPIVMKKNRLGTCLSLLCPPEEEARFKRLLFEHTSTLGIKSVPLEKTVLGTSFEQVDTPLGSVTMKHALMDGKVIRSKPELEECRELARRHNVPLSEVYYHIGKARKQ